MEKIILGKKRFVGSQNTDEFIDIELTKEFENLKTDTLYNTFDFQQQFIKERNNSLKFCLYGLVESRYGHCDDLILNIKISDTKLSSGSTNTLIYTPYNFSAATSGYSFYTSTKPLSNNSDLTKNIYGTNKGCYFFHFEIDKVDLNFNKNKSVYITIFEPYQELYGEFSIPFLFFEDNQNLIEFGTETAEFDETNKIEIINNNFPFFYDKHWIKFNLEPHGPQVVSFVNSEMITTEVGETKNSSKTIVIPITLEEPSKFGLERAKIAIDYNTNESGEQLTNGTLGVDFLFNEKVISWNVGEKTKEITINIQNDLFVENIEKIQFRLIPLSNTRVSINTNNSMVLYIESEDVPVTAHFNVGSIEIFRPFYSNNTFDSNSPFFSSFNSINSLTSDIVPITIFFNEPLPVSGEKIKVKYNSNSTAKIGMDFTLINSTNLNNEAEFDVSVNSSSIKFEVFIKSHKGYIEDREIILDLAQSTLGIVPVSQSNTNILPQIKIKLKDSTLPVSTRFTIPFNSDKNIGIFKKIFTTTNIRNTYITLQKDNLDALASINISQHNLTNDFNCNLEIENLGDKIIFNNQIINYGDKINLMLQLSSFTQNYNIDLPANYNWKGLYYNQSRYKFYFTNIEKTYPTGTTINSLNWDLLNTEDYPIKSSFNNLYSASLSGSKQYWLISEVKNSFSTLDTTNNLCLNSATAFNTGSIFYNGAIIANTYPVYQKTISTIEFSDKRVAEECNGQNSNLPVGTTLLPSPPYNKKFANINFGEILIQLKHSPTNLNSKMILESMINNQSQITDAHQYFIKWNSAYIETKTSLILEIFNNGMVEVEFLGKKIQPNDSQFYNSSEVNFGNLSLSLPTNDNYQIDKNFFKDFNYKFKLYNIKIPNSLINNPTFEIIQNYDIGNINQSLTQSQINNNFLINFYIQNTYLNIGLSSNMFGNLNCGISPSLNPNIIYKKVLLNRILIFNNTGSNLSLSSWNSNILVPDCPSYSIPFKIV